MSWFSKVRSRLRALFQKENLDARMNDEMRSHIEMQTQENTDAGMKSDEARRAALRQFGWIESIKDACRDERGVGWIENFGQDVRYGARILCKNPGFTSVAVLTLALGIGANTAIFSLINALLLRALPFPHSDELVAIWADNPGSRLGSAFSPPANADVAEWRRQTANFANIAAFSPRSVDLADGQDSERVGAAAVTAGFFETLGVTPVRGRTLALDEEGHGAPAVALISHRLWQRRFGGDPGLMGKNILVNGDSHMVIGILPPDFDFPRGAEWPAYFPFPGRTDVWLPLGLRAHDDGTGWSNWDSREERGLAVIGRMKREANLRQAQAEMDAFAARQANDHPDSHQGWSIQLVPLRRQLAGASQTALMTLFAAVGLLLLIACVNIANLLLARGMARRQEMSVRAALGAERGRLVRQLVTECLLLAGLGSGLGLLVGEGCLRAFLALNPLAHSRLDEASLDPMVLTFTATIALLTCVVFGLVLAWQAISIDLRETLHEGGRGVDGAVREKARGWLIAAEVALALVLLTMAGLMVRSFLRLQAVQPGFRADSVLAFDLQVSGAKYTNEASQVMFYEQLLNRLQTLPGVSAVGAISYLPLDGGENMGSFEIKGQPPVTPGAEPKGERRWVTPGYFAAMGIPVLTGRAFQPIDNQAQPRVVIINERLAKYFGKGDPTGQQIRMGGAWRTVVGIVRDVKSASLEGEIRPQVYVPLAQWPWTGMTIVMRTQGEPLAHVSAVRSELKALDPLLSAAKIRTMNQVVSKASSARRFNTALLTFFAGAALFLTIMGIYGVVAFLVSRRRREIGIRMALGAQRRDVLRLVLQQGMRPVALGSLAGIVGSLVASRFVVSQLYAVSSADPLTLVFILSLVFATAFVACWLPARRAAKVDPIVALRSE